ncbi:hypothetical protein ANAEL_02137 [Anaerolineales bacterium]|nr:hypothetical protein ANAEL_02137 [Anaerolineales bacterium]
MEKCTPAVYNSVMVLKNVYTAKEAAILENDNLFCVLIFYPVFRVNAASMICCTRGAMLDGSGCSPSTSRALS